MPADPAFVAVLTASLAGLIASVAIERLMTPRPPLARPWPAWAIHGGLWLTAHALLTLLLGRPWFAAAAVLAFLLMLVLVNNAKVKALREPFVFQDYEYFTDAIKHPRLYIPFLGWGKLIASVAGFIFAVSVGLWGEAVPDARFDWPGQLGGIAIAAGAGMLLLGAAMKLPQPISLDPDRDLHALGFLASLWHYGKAKRHLPTAASPFDVVGTTVPEGKRPHLVAIQSESFFDPRSLFGGIRREVLAEFDRLRTDARMQGPLHVPAWGANTVRSEFAFLTGIGEAGLGVHRFNPYRAIMAGWEVPSLASYLKRLGYRTVCIHPYPASFYLRDRVFPRLGFDEFLDIEVFEGAERFGPYISDAAVAEKIAALLQEASEPMFVFAITMENHGPLHLEQAAPGDVAQLYTSPPPDGCEDLTIYLRHLRNADRMLARLRVTLEQCDHPASLCWYGDHVPIMPSVYASFGVPRGEVAYVLWSNDHQLPSQGAPLNVTELATRWLQSAGLRDA